MDFNDVSRLMDYRSHFDGMDSDLSPCSRDSNETTSSASPPQSVTLSPRTFHELGLMECGDLLDQQFGDSFAFAEPSLVVVEEPVEKFRFRYLSETTGVHGAITGRNHSKTNKTYPSVKLLNWKGPAYIRCSLYTGQSNINERTPSCHQLVVKNASENTGTVTKPVNDGITGDVASFEKMSIINTSNKDKLTELRSKLQTRLLEEKQRTDGPRATLNSKERAKIEQEAKEQSKNGKLSNTASLFFECFDEDMRPICSVFSGIISNQKNALTNELKISRIDKHASSCLGKEEVFMLVEKVDKKYIRVRFYEVDDNDQVVWSDDASFTELDVHHQFAIVFKTPPYRRTDIEESVDVFVELYRTTDGAQSKPLNFQYRPCEKQVSRKRPRRDSALEEPLAADPMLYNGFELPQQDETFVSNTQSIEAVFNAPLLPDDALSALVDDITDFTWIESDVVIDGISAGKKKLSAEKSKKIANKTASAESKESTRPTGKSLLREVLEGCSGTTRRAQAISEIVDPFRRLCSRQTEEGNTAVHIAVDNEDHATLATLTREIGSCRCSDVLDIANENKETALHLATCLNAPDLVASLMKGGASLAPTNREGRTAAHLAVELGHDACLDAMMYASRQASGWMETKDEHGLTALHLAVVRGNIRAVRKLCASGADPGARGRNGETALHLACQEEQVEIARFLVQELRVDVDVENISGNTPMDIAVATGCQDLVQLLSRAGGQPSQAGDSSCESDSDEDFEDAESGSEIETPTPKTECADVKTNSLGSVLRGDRKQRLYDFLDTDARWKTLAEALDFGFLVGGITAENVGSPGKTLVSFAEMNGVGVAKLREELTKISNSEKVAAIFDL